MINELIYDVCTKLEKRKIEYMLPVVLLWGFIRLGVAVAQQGH